MNKIALISIILVILAGAGTAIYFATRKQGDTGIPGISCLNIDHEKWGYWNDEDRNSGMLRSLAETHFSEEGDLGLMGSIVGGWFKAVNAYPSAAMARAYETELIAWVNSNNAAPWWLVTTGEMECKT